MDIRQQIEARIEAAKAQRAAAGLYRHPQLTNSAKSRKAVRDSALDAGLALLSGVFSDPPSPHAACEMRWSLDDKANS